MAQFESSFKPETKHQESFKDRNGDYIVSRGLLQISIESANGYGCAFKRERELHDPEDNLSCGVRILNRLVERDQRIAGRVNGGWKGGARYWAVLRDTHRAFEQITSYTRRYCERHFD